MCVRMWGSGSSFLWLCVTLMHYLHLVVSSLLVSLSWKCVPVAINRRILQQSVLADGILSF